MARHYQRDPGPDPDRNFDPANDPSTPRAWLGTLLVLAVLVAVAVTGAYCTGTKPAPAAVQP